jgi:methionyl aminopeptidase
MYNIHTNPSDWEGMRKAGRLAASILDRIGEYVVVGTTTDQLNNLCHNWIIEAKAIPAPLHYAGNNSYDEKRGFPKSVCTSPNYVVCHGIPNDKPLKDGDILNIDVTVILDGWHGDTSRMFYVGSVKEYAQKLCKITYDAMMKGIEAAKVGQPIWRIGEAIETYIKASSNYTIVKDYCGHGLGRLFHTEPSILHYKSTDFQTILQEGMFFTVEPMINLGKEPTRLNMFDGWTVTTKDKSLSAQWEHSIGLTSNGQEIFTLT